MCKESNMGRMAEWRSVSPLTTVWIRSSKPQNAKSFESINL